MVLCIYIPPEQEEKCRIVISHCRRTNITLSKRVQKMINSIYTKELSQDQEN